jgi:hypothetical protein
MSEENQQATTPVVAPKPALTKEQKIARYKQRIADLELALYNCENDIVVAPAKKVVALPEVGADVVFKHGRKTATTEPVERLGRVVAVKPQQNLEGGKVSPAQIKVSIGEGFEQEFVVIYAGQIVQPGKAAD